MKTIPGKHTEDLDLHALRVLDVLFRERSITRAADALHTQQPALSKTLARLRVYFNDPLFVRVALHMEPTAKALELEKPVRALLDGFQRLRSEQSQFDASRSTREFRVFTLDAGVIVLLPPVIKTLLGSAPNVRLRAAQVGLQNLHTSLEAGEIDLAIGEFPSSAPGGRAIAGEPATGEEHHRACAELHHRCDPGQEHQCCCDDAGAGCDRAGARARHAAGEATGQTA